MSDYIKLSQLNAMVREKLKASFPSTYWLMAETSDVRVSNRHCYLEFIEKNDASNTIVAKARGYIWANTFELLKPHFEQATGQAFVSGIKVLVKVSIEFHPVYGYGLNVWDINPAYTLGDLQQKRQAILKQLEVDGVLHLNKELRLSELPQRIAVISSSTAAGYEDFCKQLAGNPYGFVFYPRLFSAVMQGDQTEKTIIAALDKIYEHRDAFDAVIIIRGGGATSDLASFDSYLLAANCAQFPLPIITGIGHERDETVLDYVAYHREKTPTAVAEYFIGISRQFSERVTSCRNAITNAAIQLLERAQSRLNRQRTYFPLVAGNLIEQKKQDVNILCLQLKNGCRHLLSFQENKLKEKESYMKLSSPEYILKKGYSITLKDGKVVKSASQLTKGDDIETILKEGRVKSSVR